MEEEATAEDHRWLLELKESRKQVLPSVRSANTSAS